MGGLVTLKNVQLLPPSGISALVLSSPALGLSLTIPKLKEKAARWLSEWAPKLTLHNEINFDHLVRDANMVRQYKTDPLRHDKISPRLFLGMLDAIQEVKKSAPDVHLPTLMQLAGREMVVNTTESEKFFDNLGSKRKEIYIYADSMHEIYNDLDRHLCLKDLFQFLDSFKTPAGDA
jgi:alpha-beta hydrolase superfamily lysophospholipase